MATTKTPPKTPDFVDIPPLDLPELDLGQIEQKDLDARGAAIREAAKKVEDWIVSTLGQLEKYDRASREIKEEEGVEEKIAKARQTIQKYLCQDVKPAYRRAAWQAYFTYKLSHIQNMAQLTKLMEELVRDKYLIEDEASEIKACGKAYAMSPNSRFGEPEMAKFKAALTNLVKRINEGEDKCFADQANLSVADFLAKEKGEIHLTILPEPVAGTAFWRSGGTILVKSDGENAKPIGATGGIRNAVKEMIELKVYLPLKYLEWENPPFFQEIDEQKGKKIFSFWHLLQRGLRHTKFIDKVSVSSQEFLLDKKPGTAFVRFRGTWKIPPDNQEVKNLFFLVCREKKEEEVATIRIVDLPRHLKEFFSQCMAEYTEQDEKFEGVAYPLNAVLQACFGQEQRETTRAAQINNGS